MYKLGDKVLYNDTEHIITGVRKKNIEAYEYLINKKGGISFEYASKNYDLLEGTTMEEVYGVFNESLTLLNIKINFDTL